MVGDSGHRSVSGNEGFFGGSCHVLRPHHHS